ncbi:hypothetical protein ACFWM0_24995 [Streptomyces sp. NPDC058405]|uniref:hypothetical protein n=1 Tax=Streptomyces sp. NPDC058405 TaxID=3346482 RepID=UPI00365960AB
MTSQYANLTPGTATPNQNVIDLIVVSDTTSGGTPAWTDITGKPATFPPTLGTSGTTAAAGNDARLLTGTATAVNSAAGANPTKAEYDALLVALRARGIITGT